MVRRAVLALCLCAASAFVSPAVSRARAPAPLNAKGAELRDRIKSVGNTQKITTAMRLVAAAKVRKAQAAVLASRPFGEAIQSAFTGVVSKLEKEPTEEDIPLLEKRPVKKVTIIAVSADKGLCGSYNTYAIKRTEQRMKELTDQGIEVELIPIGTKLSGYFGRRGYVFPKKYNCPQVPNAELATELSRDALTSFLGLETDKVELVYTKFVSLIASKPMVRSILPLTATGIETAGDEYFELKTDDGKIAVKTTKVAAPPPTPFPADLVFEQEPVMILNTMLPLYLDAQILRCLQEAVASELASRMSSMQAASDNARDLKKALSQKYNRIRQASVTAEILEIVSGAGM
ncbi:gamma subunit of H+-transporting two-sector ATPase [Pelagophyceae sp. CCMP2097]|nr:gamma subunit of H+-transporting two-sector ATPase [Pelagophyceae sp. CCMP2097]